jgi:hypothetical protein
MNNPAPPPPNWKIITAAILDFLLAFLLIGTIIARLTGNIGERGWNLSGWPAAMPIALIVAYFTIGNRVFGGTVFKHLLGIARRPRP